MDLPPKVFDTLVVFAQNPNRVLDKDFLLKQIWPDTAVEERSLIQSIFRLRKILGEDQEYGSVIETIKKRGYRFRAEVRERGVEVADTTLGQGVAAIAEQPCLGRPRRVRRRTLTLCISAGLLLALAGSTWRWVSSTRETDFRQPPRLTQLTDSGDVFACAVSPSGAHIATVQGEVGAQSIWLHQFETRSGIQVVSGLAESVSGLTFGSKENYLYYTAYNGTVGTLYRVPALGGMPSALLEGVDSCVAFSPDGKRLAFKRNLPRSGETALFLAESDGSGARLLSTKRWPEAFGTESLAWAPDGRGIACTVERDLAHTKLVQVAVLDSENGHERRFKETSFQRVGQMLWSQDGAGLYLTAQTSAAPGDQIWHLAWPKGAVRQITDGRNHYSGLAQGAQARSLVACQTIKHSQFWTIPVAPHPGAPKVGGECFDVNSDGLGLACLPDGRIVLGSDVFGTRSLVSMYPDGSGCKPMLSTSNRDGQPSVSTNGRIAFVSRSGDAHQVWCMERDGSGIRQLTSGRVSLFPRITPDGAWVCYLSPGEGDQGQTWMLWKVASEGGKPVRLWYQQVFPGGISPDGRCYGFAVLDVKTNLLRLAWIPLDGGEPHFLPGVIPPNGYISWHPDNSGLVYVETRKGVSNFWLAPLSGGTPRPVTHFAEGLIYRYAWSLDGKQIVAERGKQTTDVVLLETP